MRLAEFDYALPLDRIAQLPADPRESSRLLVALGDQIEHRRARELADYIEPGDVVVVNDTKVLPARIRFARASGGAGEVLLLEPLDAARRRWVVLARPSRKLARGSTIRVGTDLAITFGRDLGEGKREVEVETPDLAAALDRYGELPLPPYLQGPLADPGRYQTVYAQRAASAAAPTAGLHLSQGVLNECRGRGAEVVAIELVVGLDTFRPITTDYIDDHRMHSESYRIAADAWQQIGQARRVVAVGTTSVRALESAARSGCLEGRTDIFIKRGFEFQVTDWLLTNFHMPRSSLLVMIDAFIGPRWRSLYDIALATGYRFLSLGDAMLLERQRRS